MNSNICRLCNSKLFSKPIIKLEGMPRAAQHFPSQNEFKDDKGIILNVFQCSDCRLVQLNIDPVDYFKEVITAASFSDEAKFIRLKQMTKFVSQFRLHGKKVLEVGSGKGNMLDILEKAGVAATGIEASLKSVKIAKSTGRNMIHDYIGDIEKLKGHPFDAFVSFNYIEHMPKPGAIIKKIYNNITSNAVGFVTVPNLDYLLRTRCFYEFVADHLSYFTKNTLIHAFERNNFNVLECYTINEDNDIVAIVKKKRPNNTIALVKKTKPLDISGHFKEVDNLINNLQQIVNRYTKKNKKIAIWGAGHRTLALLALSKLNNIAYVVDSAKFKQGQFTPVLHLKIVPPEYLKQKNVDLIIIMVPGLYPGEVLKSLKKMKLGIEVAILRGNQVEFI
ncbi:MAG: methyltransferase domain-containing protein [Bacteroidota bacterium]|nr:methyltransferase domain-containing protein [Bacteroidota bacterium]